jgi:hypothetical protein
MATWVPDDVISHQIVQLWVPSLPGETQMQDENTLVI